MVHVGPPKIKPGINSRALGAAMGPKIITFWASNMDRPRAARNPPHNDLLIVFLSKMVCGGFQVALGRSMLELQNLIQK